MARPDYVPSGAEDITDHGIGQDHNPNDPDLDTATEVREAVIQAANAAGDNGAIYVPSGTYHLGRHGGMRLAIGIDTDSTGISIYGDGPGGEDEPLGESSGSTLALTEHIPDDERHIFTDWSDTDHGNVVFKGIRFDGNASNPEVNPDNGVSRFSQFDRYGGSGSLTMESVYLHDWYQTAIRIGNFDCEARRCTFKNIGVQSRKNDVPGGQLLAGAESPIVVEIQNCKFSQFGGIPLNADYNSKFYISDCWFRSIGNSLAKVDGMDLVQIRRTYYEGNTEWTEREMPDKSSARDEFKGRHFINKNFNDEDGITTIDVEDVEARSFTFGALRGNASLELVGDRFSLHEACKDTDEGAIDDGNGDGYQFDVVEMSIHDSHEPAFFAPNSSGSIDTLYHDGNSGGVGDTGSISYSDGGPEMIEPDTVSEAEVGIHPTDGGGGTEEEIVDYHWVITHPDGTSETLSGETASFDPHANGEHEIELTVTNDLGLADRASDILDY